MTNFLWVVVITFIAGCIGTGIGGFIGALFKKDNSKIVSLLLSFAGGVMLAVVCFDLVTSAISPEDNMSVNIFIVIGGLILGFGIIYLLNLLIDKKTNTEVKHIIENEDHPKTADNLDEIIHSNHYTEHANECFVDKSKLLIAGLVMVFAIALHNVPEGMVIGASVANSGIATGGSALALAIVIGLHNIPEGMAISVPLITGGTKRFKAVVVTAISGLPTVIGAMLGYFLGTLGPIWLSLALSFASGAMLYVVFGELLPASILMWRSKIPAIAIMFGIFVGLVIIFA